MNRVAGAPGLEAAVVAALADSRVYDVATISPLVHAPRLSRRLGHEVQLKREDLQPGFSFKCRGAYNMMARLPRAQLERGVVAASAGNHAQGVSLAARRLGSRATIVMPVTTPSVKVEAVRALDARVLLEGDTFTEACAVARQLAADEGLVFVHPFDDLDVIAGQASVGHELMCQCDAQLDAVFVPVGGGGLLAGVAAAVKAVAPRVRVIGVQTQDSDAMARSLRLGYPVELAEVGLFCDGTAVKRVGDLTLQIAQRCVDDMVLVDTDEVCAAIRDVFEDTRVLVEPAGALAVAGLKKFAERSGVAARPLRLSAITSGANVNFSALRFIASRSDIGLRQESLWQVTAESPHQLLQRICMLLEGSNITELGYRRHSVGPAHLVLGVATRSQDEADALATFLCTGGLGVRTLASDEVAKTHVRYMVGGGAPGRGEHIFQLQLPERPNALLEFVTRLPEAWEITLAHYRSDGQLTGNILIGLQVPAGDEKNVESTMERLHRSCLRHDDNATCRAFLTQQPQRC